MSDLPAPFIDEHASVGSEALQQEAIRLLASNRFDPKLLYVTARQAELWRQVFLRHSPIHGNPEFTRIYREAFARVTDQLPSGEKIIVGLGCGTGAKERELYLSLKNRGHVVKFSAIDVSRDLVIESAQKLSAVGAVLERSLVCDLGQSEFLANWLEKRDAGLQRLVTFFGLVPNSPPSGISRIFRAVLRPGDVLLVSAHLAPIRNEEPEELTRAMSIVLPQYDNPETLAWISAAIEHWNLTDLVDPPAISFGQIEGIPAFLGLAPWKNGEKKALRLFYSLRYTPRLFEEFLRREGFAFELLAITSCQQEAIWAVRVIE